MITKQIDFKDSSEFIDATVDMISICSIVEVISERKDELFAEQLAAKLNNLKMITEKLYKA